MLPRSILGLESTYEPVKDNLDSYLVSFVTP